jgi:hypothetical protein
MFREEHWNPYCEADGPMSSGAFRKIGTDYCESVDSILPILLPPRTLLEPVYCETRSVHSPGKSDNWNKYCENVSSEEKRGCSSHDIHKGWRSLPK